MSRAVGLVLSALGAGARGVGSRRGSTEIAVADRCDAGSRRVENMPCFRGIRGVILALTSVASSVLLGCSEGRAKQDALASLKESLVGVWTFESESGVERSARMGRGPATSAAEAAEWERRVRETRRVFSVNSWNFRVELRADETATWSSSDKRSGAPIVGRWRVTAREHLELSLPAGDVRHVEYDFALVAGQPIFTAGNACVPLFLERVR